MFDSKLQTLFKVPQKASVKNAFVTGALKSQAVVSSGNGAKKYSTTGNPFVDQFGVMGNYKSPRSFAEISKDCETLWAEDPLMAVKFAIYLRIITRKTTMFNGRKTDEPQRGGELKHEAIMRMLWLHDKAPDVFWKNIPVYISSGSWKDVFVMLRYDLEHHGWDKKVLDWNRFGNLILSGLNAESQTDLVKKYLPQLKARSKCTTIASQANTMIAKWLCGQIFTEITVSDSVYKRYRKLKSSGAAHEWQKLISQGKHDLIDFDKIHGRALTLLVKSKYLANQGLSEKYDNWISNDDTTDVKYTGFVHELFSGLRRTDKARCKTADKQFMTLVNKGRSAEINTSLIVVRDTSSSMGSKAPGTTMSCYDIGKALALYFSEFLTGNFADAWIEFNSRAQMCTWKGQTPTDKWFNDRSSYVGGTNFQSVITLFATLKNQGIPEDEFPSGILCISDSEFNPTQLGVTNVEAAKKTLRNAGFSKTYVDNFVIVLWNLQNSYYGRGSGTKFETYGDVKNVFYFSGYSAATIAFLTNEIKTAGELFEAAMSQEILNLIEL